MSTQDPDSGIPISVLGENDLQPFRLLELPAELLALVTSETTPRLQLKSKENIEGNAQDASVVLCTQDKTYDIRQVNTSNSVFLTQQCETPDEGGGLLRVGIEAVATLDSTLELLAVAKQSAVPYIKAAVPVYASTGIYGLQKSVSRVELFAHIPLSETECEDAWSELACFESINPSGCFIPSAKVRVQIWQTAYTAAVAEGADLAKPFPAGDAPGWAADLVKDWPAELVSAVFASVSIPSPEQERTIEEERCVRFVGLSQLQARSEGKSTDTAGFLKVWRDAVPEKWRSKCELSALKGSYSLQNGGKSITSIESGPAIAAAADGSAPDAKSTLGAKRKWHEKFRASKKTS